MPEPWERELERKMDARRQGEYVGPWIARFMDGPCAGGEFDRVFAVGPWAQTLVLAPNPLLSSPVRWLLVAAPDTLPDEPWPRQVIYRMRAVIREVGLHGEPVVQFYIDDDGGNADGVDTGVQEAG